MLDPEELLPRAREILVDQEPLVRNGDAVIYLDPDMGVDEWYNLHGNVIATYLSATGEKCAYICISEAIMPEDSLLQTAGELAHAKHICVLQEELVISNNTSTAYFKPLVKKTTDDKYRYYHEGTESVATNLLPDLFRAFGRHQMLRNREATQPPVVPLPTFDPLQTHLHSWQARSMIVEKFDNTIEDIIRAYFNLPNCPCGSESCANFHRKHKQARDYLRCLGMMGWVSHKAKDAARRVPSTFEMNSPGAPFFHDGENGTVYSAVLSDMQRILSLFTMGRTHKVWEMLSAINQWVLENPAL